ncbi:cyclic lactone autoinducer peptide [Ruminococcus flavefaciens]|uniref:cyclic lactone autoinducer peptide n=1 Tax=Ruminococcus flavefaciens TaxID=1265 RepID=UPI0026EB0978|nr:cyclic lactone autoinducer peptide [Ruminococcus flavefaciens]
MKANKLLKKVANLAEATAIKANGMTSWWETYQPVEPKMVRQMAEAQKKQK